MTSLITDPPVPSDPGQGVPSKPQDPPAGPGPQADEPQLRVALGRDLVALGFIVVLAALGIAVLFFRTAADVAAAIGPITTMIGTLVGTVFGTQTAARNQAAQTQAAAQPDIQSLLALRAATLLPEAQQAQMLDEIQRQSSTRRAAPTIEVF